MLQTPSILRTRTPTDQARVHTRHLIALLTSQLDAVSRHELYRCLAARRGVRNYDAIFQRMIDSDRRHIEWLKSQIAREVAG